MYLSLSIHKKLILKSILYIINSQVIQTLKLGLLDIAHNSSAVVCFHFLQCLFQLLNQMEQGGWVCLQNLGVVISILTKVQLYSHWWFNLLPEASACKLYI